LNRPPKLEQRSRQREVRRKRGNNIKMSSQTTAHTTPPAPLPENLSRAFKLYWQAKALSQYVKSPDRHTALALIRIAGDAIQEFSNTNQDKIIELERIILEAKQAVPPEGLKELCGRAVSYIIEKVFPKNSVVRAALLTVLGAAILLSAGVPAWHYFRPISYQNVQAVSNGPVVNDDPLKIDGKWTYTTKFKEKRPIGPDGVELAEVMGFNSIEITSDRIGYRMDGARTHYKNVGSNEFKPYDPQLHIELSRISYSSDRNSFSFQFEVKRDGKIGFAEMYLKHRTADKIVGEIYYLDSNKSWTIADIIFTRQH
jgi:hypothetical protein